MLQVPNKKLTLALFPQEILRTTCEALSVPLPDLTSLLSNMHSLMKENRGVGLAAPQVGLAFRFFIMQATSSESMRVFINPQLINVSQEQELAEEGCLSLPCVYAPVFRSCEVELEYLNVHGEQKREIFTGFKARIIQHELDHLNGVLFVDRIEASLKRKLLKKYLDSLKKVKGKQ